jgi:uncharacterized protein YdeI (YjbR/CyaY-like superfamily)
MPKTPTPTFFPSPVALRAWLATHHATAPELWVGFFKRSTGTPSVTWPEAVDEALCAGWIDGVRKRIDNERYMIRFTPRRETSTWSAVNINRIAALTAEGRMLPAGLAAFSKRREHKSRIYAYEQRPVTIPEPYASRFKKDKRAWAFFEAQAPWYRKTTAWWVISAKKEETRVKRLQTLIDACRAGKVLR